MAKIGAPPERAFNPIDANVLAALSGSEIGAGTTHAEHAVQGQPITNATPNVEPGNRSSTNMTLSTGSGRETPLNRIRRFKVSTDEDVAIDRAMGRLSESLSAKVGFSHVARCLLRLYLDHETRILELARHSDARASRPANGDVAATLEFERKMAGVIRESLTSDQHGRHEA